MVTGMNLAQCSREGYSKVKSILLYVMMELAIIGSDIQEVSKGVKWGQCGVRWG